MKAFRINYCGFTLVELVVVILLLGILAAYAMPKFFNLDDYRTRAAYDELAGAVRYAQKLAVASGCEVQVQISGSSYSLQQHSMDCTSGAFATISGHPVTSNNLMGVALTSTAGDFTFNALGCSSSSTTVNINGGIKSFVVIAETGYVDAP